VAIDVPERLALAVFDAGLAETIDTPGAWMSTQVPKLENDARASLASVAPVTIPSPTPAGEPPQPLAPSLPEAIAVLTPSLIMLRTAVFRAVLAEPPRLMLATAGWPA
jgi:hypothetical protein